MLSWGPHGLFVLSVADSAGLPIIGGVDALVIAMAVRRPRVAYLGALWAVLGSIVGSLILFAIARKGGEVFLEKHISTKRGKRLHAWFERYGLVAVFVPALSPIPLPMKICIFCAGALEVRWSYFTAVIASARAIRYFALAYLALTYGHATFQFLAAHPIEVTSVAVGLTIAAIVILQIVTRRQASRPSRIAQKQ